MRLLAIIAILISTPAHADAFRDREIAWQALNALDAAQTCYAVGTGRGHEGNPLARAVIGKYPSCPAVIGFKAANGALHLALAHALPEREARLFQIASLVVQGGVVAANFRVVF